MTAGKSAAPDPDPRAGFDRLLGELRPKLHRYCARMTGSVIDGEDVVQDALIKAIEAFPQAGDIANVEGWLFRITHNAALDFLRRRARQEAGRSQEDPDMILDPVNVADQRQAAAATLRTFLRLPVAQRSSVILMDVLGYSLDEICSVMDMTLPAIKAALHRGRVQLRAFADEPDEPAFPALGQADRLRLAGYVDRFNARDFDAVRDMLAEDVQLELVGKLRLNGRGEVGNYVHNYSRVADWCFVAGIVEGRTAVLVRDPADPTAAPSYFVLLDWAESGLVGIRDFRFARYAIDGADVQVLD
jgi:RNA polymerase sigma-70 factor (ECF subfamily)